MRRALGASIGAGRICSPPAAVRIDNTDKRRGDWDGHTLTSSLMLGDVIDAGLQFRKGESLVGYSVFTVGRRSVADEPTLGEGLFASW